MAPGTKKQKKGSKMTSSKIIDTAIAATGPLYYFQHLRSMFSPVNESKLLIGCIMIIMNVASKYVDFGFSKAQEQALRNGIARELIIFAACFMGTRDIVLSIILTASFAILANIFLHDDSKYCVVPNYLQKMTSLIDINKDGIITPEEEKRAIEILEKADQMREYGSHAKFTTYMNNNM